MIFYYSAVLSMKEFSGFLKVLHQGFAIADRKSHKCQGWQNWGMGVEGWGWLSLFCQAKLYVVLDFKILTIVLNCEIAHSIYYIMVVVVIVCSIPKPKNAFGYPSFQNYYQEDIQKITSNHF